MNLFGFEAFEFGGQSSLIAELESLYSAISF